MEEKKEDIGPETSAGTGDWNQLVDAASEHAKERTEAMAAAETPAPKRGQWVILVALSVLFLAVCSWNIYYFFLAGDPSPEFEAASLQASIYIAHQAIEGVREETGSIPASLEEVGADDEDLEYTVSHTGYILTARGEHHTFTFSEGGDLTPYEAAFRSLLSREINP